MIEYLNISREEAKNMTQDKLTPLVDVYCKCCGKSVFWSQTQFAMKKDVGKIKIQNRSHLTTKSTLNNTYNLKVCETCFDKKFTNVKSKSKLFNTWNEYVLYCFDIPKKEYDAMNSKRAITLENMIRKYGVEEGQKRWDMYRKKQSETNTFEYKRDKYGWTREQFDKYNSERAVTLKNLIKRHGEEEGIKKFNDYCERQSYAGVKKEYFIEKYGEIKGELLYDEMIYYKSRSLQSYIDKYSDPDVAMEKFLDGNQRNSENGYSNISQDLFKKIDDKMPNNNFYYALKNQEFSIYNHKIKGINFIDFYDKDTKKVIEFYGNYWHGNPVMYESGTYISFPNKKKKLVNKIWEDDKKRIDGLKDTPMVKDILIIWEDEFINTPDETINKCIEFLRG